MDSTGRCADCNIPSEQGQHKRDCRSHLSSQKLPANPPAIFSSHYASVHCIFHIAKCLQSYLTQSTLSNSSDTSMHIPLRANLPMNFRAGKNLCCPIQALF